MPRLSSYKEVCRPNRQRWLFLVGCLAVWLCAGIVASAGEMKWTHFTIADPLPSSGYGTGGIPLADYDGDGDLDVVISRRGTETAYWFERKDDATWIRHAMGTSEGLKNALGAAALDINNDGFIDAVLDWVWFQNPGTLAENPDAPWPAHRFESRGHDIVAADMNGDGRLDIVTYHGTVVSWFDPAAGMKQTDVGQGAENHGGIAPKGIGDLDGDGDLDIVIPLYWFENPGKGVGPWPRHGWPHLAVRKASYGPSMRSWIVDLNGDGHNDIVYSDCDTSEGHVYWAQNLGNGAQWKRTRLIDPPTAPGDVPGTGSYHSLGVADFDGDGNLDIFAGEQEDASSSMEAQGKLPMKIRGHKERGVIWLGSGGPNPTFTPVVIQIDNPGWHDAAIGDVDGDGDIDIVTKIWNKDGENYHADYWRNDTVQSKIGQTLRVLTYNIHHGEGTDERFDYERLAQVINDLSPDIVALQEVDRGTERASGVDQAKLLGQLCKMHHAFGQAMPYQDGEYGEAILSRFPIEKVVNHPLPYSLEREPRAALEVRIRVEGVGPLVFVGTHLCHLDNEIRTLQTRRMAQLFAKQEGPPVILAGDFNARPGSDPMSVLLQDGWTDVIAPRSRIDYVLVRASDPWKVKEVIIVDEPIASDHDPVLAVLEWQGN